MLYKSSAIPFEDQDSSFPSCKDCLRFLTLVFTFFYPGQPSIVLEMTSTRGDPGTQASSNPIAMVPEATKTRKEIDEILDDNDMTNLFLIALSEMQQEDGEKRDVDKTEDWFTFYSLAGILNRTLFLKTGLTRCRHPWAARRVVEPCQGQDGLGLLPSWLYGVSDLASSLRDCVRGRDYIWYYRTWSRI